MRVDLRSLLWRLEDWQAIVKEYPYQHVPNKEGRNDPAIIRADWLLIQLADESESNAYRLLLFGGDNQPKNRDEWLAKLGVSTTEGLNDLSYFNYGIVEGNSGVAKNLIRWIETRPVNRGYAWGTRDVLEVTTDKDPLEQIDGNFKHDGEEWIVGVPKLSLTTGERATLQVYALANGEGGLVAKAPVDLVEDSTRFRGFREIRNPGSCIQCHNRGLNEFKVNELRNLVESGVDPFAKDKKTQLAIEAFHLSDLKKDVERANEDFSKGVELATGLTCEEASKSFTIATTEYDKVLKLEDTAREMHADPAEWRLAIAAASAKGNRLGARLSGLVHDQTIPRDAWEDRYLETYQYWKEWKNVPNKR
jgi:hypothetical protein